MHISDDRTIRELQEEFSTKFPFLKIDFFKKNNGAGKDAPYEKIQGDLLIGQIRGVHNTGHFYLESNLTAQAFEQTMLDIFDLKIAVRNKSAFAQLFSKGGREKTLGEKNYRGMMMEEKLVIV